MVRLVALLLLIAVPLAAASAEDVTDAARQARAFLDQVYSHYPTPAGRTPFDPLGGSAAQIFDPAMVGLLEEDRKLTAPGEVGAIDWDPLCQCQDDDGMRVEIGRVEISGPATANVHVELPFPSNPTAVELALTRVAGEWRIHDVSSKDTPSLRDLLMQANRERAKGGKR